MACGQGLNFAGQGAMQPNALVAPTAARLQPGLGSGRQGVEQGLPSHNGRCRGQDRTWACGQNPDWDVHEQHRDSLLNGTPTSHLALGRDCPTASRAIATASTGQDLSGAGSRPATGGPVRAFALPTKTPFPDVRRGNGGLPSGRPDARAQCLVSFRSGIQLRTRLHGTAVGYAVDTRRVWTAPCRYLIMRVARHPPGHSPPVKAPAFSLVHSWETKYGLCT